MPRQLQDDSTSSTHVPGPYDDAVRILSELPPPRPVRLSYRGKFTLVTIPAAPLGVAALVAVQEHHRSTGMTLRGGLEALTIVLVVLGMAMLWIYARQKRLVSEGELAIGRVTGLAGSSRLGRYLRYEFTAHLGERLSYMAWYNFPILSTGMRLPVFYDRENPHKKVALCDALYRVVLPEEGSSPHGEPDRA